jgi:hypothetical protein
VQEKLKLLVTNELELQRLLGEHPGRLGCMDADPSALPTNLK